jgi:hypothetical protein
MTDLRILDPAFNRCAMWIELVFEERHWTELVDGQLYRSPVLAAQWCLRLKRRGLLGARVASPKFFAEVRDGNAGPRRGEQAFGSVRRGGRFAQDDRFVRNGHRGVFDCTRVRPRARLQ